MGHSELFTKTDFDDPYYVVKFLWKRKYTICVALDPKDTYGYASIVSLINYDNNNNNKTEEIIALHIVLSILESSYQNVGLVPKIYKGSPQCYCIKGHNYDKPFNNSCNILDLETRRRKFSRLIRNNYTENIQTYQKLDLGIII